MARVEQVKAAFYISSKTKFPHWLSIICWLLYWQERSSFDVWYLHNRLWKWGSGTVGLPRKKQVETHAFAISKGGSKRIFPASSNLKLHGFMFAWEIVGWSKKNVNPCHHNLWRWLWEDNPCTRQFAMHIAQTVCWIHSQKRNRLLSRLFCSVASIGIPTGNQCTHQVKNIWCQPLVPQAVG